MPSSSIDAQIGLRLRRRRSDLGLTSAQLAFAVNINESELVAYEMGRSRIGAAKLFQFCSYLQVRVAYFFHDQPANDRR